MHDVRTRTAHPLAAATLVAAAIVLAVLPISVSQPIRTLTVDAAGPGLSIAHTVADVVDSTRSRLLDRSDLESRIAELETRLQEAERRRRASELLAARSAVAAEENAGPELVVPDAVVARVLGTEAADTWRAGRVADVGFDAGIREDADVLAVEGPFVDRGRDGDVEDGSVVLDGRIVVGRIRAVGRWTSVVQPVTADDYRVRAHVARRSKSGMRLGPSGILRGTGEGTCRLDFVDSTESVEPGDEIYTAPDESSLARVGPLLLGKVVTAELPAGAPHWEIEVAPAAPESPRRVSILRRRFNPARLLAN